MADDASHPISQAVLTILHRLLGARVLMVGRVVGASFVVHEGIDLDRDRTLTGVTVPLSDTMAAEVVASRAPVIRSEGIARFERGLGARAVLIVPVQLRDGTLAGTLAALHRESRSFGESDLALVADLARAVAAEVEEALTLDRAVEVERARLAGLLARGLAHDFGNIVSSALANLRSLSRLVEQMPEAREPIEEITASLEAGRELITRLRDVGRTDPRHARRRGFDPTAVASKVVAIARGLFGKQGSGDAPWVDLRLVPPDLPIEVRGDEHAIEQALLNLVLNARDAVRERGGGRVTVRVLHELVPHASFERPWQTAGQWALLAVDDDGPGIDPRMAARVFEPGFTTKGELGSGLGLFLVKTTATAHGGGVIVATSPEGGARLAIALPATQRGSTATFRPPIVLVADDERGLRRACARELAAAGLAVAEAASRAAALEIVEADPKRIVAAIVDRDLGDGSGEDVVKRIRALNPKALVIETSGADVDGVLEKPFDLSALVNRVLNAVRQPG